MIRKSKEMIFTIIANNFRPVIATESHIYKLKMPTLLNSKTIRRRSTSAAELHVEMFLIYLFSGTRRRKVSGTIRNERATRMITTVMVTIHPCTEGEQGHYPPLCGGEQGHSLSSRVPLVFGSEDK